MKPEPTGRLQGNDLILTRSFRATIEDVWTSVTSSESTARWIGPWEGEPGPGTTIGRSSSRSCSAATRPS